MTLYDLLREYYRDNILAPLSPKAKEQIGMQLYEKWKDFSPEKPPKVMIEEAHGTFLVNNYPDEFVPVMRQKIEEFYQHITEKPASSEPKKRARKPVQKPILSGKDLKK